LAETTTTSITTTIPAAAAGAPRHRQIHVLHVGPGHGQRGGIASTLAELAAQKEAFSAAGVSLAVLETHGFRRAIDLLRFFVHDVPRFARALGRTDIVHFHVSVRGSFIRKCLLHAIARLRARPVVFHLHAGNFGQFYARSPGMVRRAITWFTGSADTLVAVSNAVGQELRGLGRDDCRLHVVGNMATLAEQAAAAASPPPQGDSDAPYVAFAGRLTVEKGVGTLLQAVAMLKEQGCCVPVRFAGGGNIAHWQQRAHDLGIADRVSFAGWLDGDAKLAFYRHARVFCMPSHYESFGIATLEAMYAGLPVVGSRLGGFLDLVEEGATGYLVEPSDIPALATRLRGLWEQPALAGKLGAAGLVRARERFGRQAIVSRLVDCYREVAARR
jgi:glycosyltransferase involved in cell wall biosynthesis